MSTVEIKINLKDISASIGTLAALSFIIWLVTLTDFFGIYRYSKFFFWLSLILACLYPFVDEIVNHDNVKNASTVTGVSGIKNIVVITGVYFLVIYVFITFNWINREDWINVFWILESLFIVSAGTVSATPKYPKYLKRRTISLVGWVILLLAKLIGSIWFLAVIGNPFIVSMLSSSPIVISYNKLFYSATATLFIGWFLYQMKYKGIIIPLKKASEILLMFPISIALILLASSAVWPVLWSQLQMQGQFLILTFLAGLVIYVPLSAIKVTSHKSESELTRQISKGVETKLDNIYQNQYKDLKVQNVVLQVNKDITFTQTNIIAFKVFAGSYIVPITKEGKTIGGVFFGNGYYNINAKYRDYKAKFYGDALVVSHKTFWDQIVNNGTVSPPYQPIAGADRLIETAKNKLMKFSTWVPSKTEYKRKKGGDRVSIHFPFFHMDIDDNEDFVDISIGPIKIKSQGEKSYVRVGPFLAIDDVTTTIKTSLINAMITDETGEEIYFAASKNKVILRHGTADIYIKPGKIVIFDKGIKVHSTDKSILISSPALKMAYKKGKSLRLKTENANLKVYADTGIVKFSNSKIIKLRDKELAEKILNMIEEMSGDFVRELLEKGTLESFSDFLSNLEF